MSVEMLLLALARLVARERAIPILTSQLDDLPGHAALALGEIGGADEVAVLRGHLQDPKAWVRKEVQRAIHKIEKRLRKEEPKHR